MVAKSMNLATDQLRKRQFHTPESLQAKESVHVLYERLRRPDVTAAEREEVCRAMDATFSSLEVPVDVLTARR